MHYKKSLGQNFIYDTNLLKSIAKDALVCREDVVVEIGAGAGTLTRVLAGMAKRVIAFEIDESLREAVERQTSIHNNCDLIFADALKYPLEELHKKLGQGDGVCGQNYKVVANLPYYITTPLLFKFLDDEKCTSLTVMLQKEVAMRIAARENTSDYGILSVICQAVSEVVYNRTVSKKMFTPMPNVDSAVITLKKRLLPSLKNIEHFKRVVKASFAMRRKTLVNNLVKEFSLPREKAESLLQGMGKSKSIRGETLSVEEFIELSCGIAKQT